MHLHQDQIDPEGIALLRAIYEERAKNGERDPLMIMELLKQLERMTTLNQRLRDHMESRKAIDWESIVKRSQ